MATETVADLDNSALCCNALALLYKLNDMAESIVRDTPPTLQPSLASLMRDPYLRQANAKPDAYVNIFVGGFL